MSLKMIMIATFSLLSLNAFAGFLKEGGYRGEQNDKAEVNLLLKTTPGREGSFFAVLMRNDKQVSLYSIDVINDSSYSMTPLEVTNDGEIGIVNDDPSLVVTTAKNPKGEDVFKIMSANSSNTSGFTGFFEFNGKKATTEWLSINEGQYKTDENKDALQISSLNQTDREATAVFLTEELSGTFSLKEKFPAMFLINQNSTLSTGTQKSQIPSAIGIFIRKASWFGTSSQMLLINPTNDKDIKTFIKK
jgi:hypothetical protein